MTQAVWKHLHPADVAVERCRADEVAQRRGLTAELDERWSEVGKNAEPRWLWQAIEPQRGTVLADGFGRRQDAVLRQRQALVEPCGITRFDPEGWGAYERHLDPEPHAVGTQQTQNIASTHIKVRTRMTRLVRRTLGFSKTTMMHDLVLGLFINRDECGRCL